jgi:hypothetical protein
MLMDSAAGELLAVHVESIQLREDHWVVADLLGKAGHIRTVPIPAWVKAYHVLWRVVDRTGRPWRSPKSRRGRNGPAPGGKTSTGL